MAIIRGVPGALMAMMMIAAAVLGWLATQPIDWLEPYSTAACLMFAGAFAAATALVATPEKRVLGAKIGLAMGVVALAPVLFLAVVLFAFDPTFSGPTGVLLLGALALGALVYTAIRVLRVSTP